VQFNSFIKFGSLAFDVANDEKVRQLFGMTYHGARRRGLIGQGQSMHPQMLQQMAPPAGQTHPAHWPKLNQPIPFSSAGQANAKPATSAPAPAQQAQPAAKAPDFDVKQWLNMDNAKKVLGWAGTINQFLEK
jgi:hypothetical protein